MATIPDLGQAHETYGEVKLVQWVPNPSQRVDKGKSQRKTKPITEEL